MSQDDFSLDDFGGTVRLFPLPNLVLFPHVAQPLHIFEPRYRQLMADALADDRLIGIALLQPGWEEDYHKRPPIHPMICLGRIHQEEELSEGRYNLLLHGLTRARVRQEINHDKLYRIARVELCADVVVSRSGLERELRERLGSTVTPYFSAHPQALQQLRQLLQSPMPLGALCDVFSFALPLEVDVKQQLLDTLCVQRRIEILLDSLQDRTPPVISQPTRRPYPPEFSEN